MPIKNNYNIAGLYAIADNGFLDAATLIPSVRLAIEGGASAVQFRDKSSDSAGRHRQAAALLKLCRHYHVPLIINDDVAMAAAIGADGVHLGQEDMAAAAARTRLGPERLIGVSCYDDLERAKAAQSQGADYVAFGSFFSSPTKPQVARAPVDLLRRAREELNLPVVAIGGITPENGANLVASGAHALAVISGLFDQPDIRQAAQNFAHLFDYQNTQ